MSLQYSVALLLLACSLCIIGQTTDASRNPNSPFSNDPNDPLAGLPNDQVGERPHTPIERFQQKLANEAPTFPADSEPLGPPGTVSVRELRNEPPKTELSLLQRAARYAESGDHDTAIQVLKRGLSQGGLMPNVRGMLGTEYLKTGQISAAITQLKLAAELAPSVAVNFANLGFALCRVGDLQGGERAVREAIKLDRNAPKSHFLLGLILMDRGAPEAREELMMAQSHVTAARLALAVYHKHRGEAEEAQRHIQAFLRSTPSADSHRTEVWVASVAALDRPTIAFGFASVRE
jgi:Flp pilus assembly protein TadD